MIIKINKEISHFDIYDPKNWKNLDNKSNDILLEQDPTRELNLSYSNDKYFKHFPYVNYSKKI